MSWKGSLIKAGISSDGKNIDIFRGNLTVYGDFTATGGMSLTGALTFSGVCTFTNTTGPIVVSGAATLGISITGACTTGMNLSGAMTDGIIISGACSDNGIEITGTCATAVSIGTSTTDMALGTTVANKGIEIYTSSASVSTGTSCRPIYLRHTVLGTGGVGHRAEFHTRCDVVVGTWINALKGYMEFDASLAVGRTTGLASAICAEMKMPNSAVSTGEYFPLEIEWVGQASSGPGVSHGFMTLRATGTRTNFDASGFFFDIRGLTAGATAMLSAQKQTLKVATDATTTRYLLLSTAANCLTLGACTVGVNLTGAMTDGVIISGACSDNGIEISGTCTDAAIDIQGTQTAAGLLISGTAVSGISISGTCSDNGILIGGTYDHGIRFSADPVGGDNTNSFINIGDYGTAVAVAPTTAHMFGVMHNVTMAVNVAYWYQAYYTKITTSGTTTTSSVAGHALRMQIGSSLAAVYGIQCHTNITATNTCTTEIISVSAYVNLASGSTTTSDRVCALQAMIEGAGGVVTGDSIVAYLVNAGTASDTDSILELKNQSACTVASAMTLDLDGTVTRAFDFQGTASDAWTSGDAAVTQADEYVKIPVRVAGVTPVLYILAAETWA